MAVGRYAESGTLLGHKEDYRRISNVSAIGSFEGGGRMLSKLIVDLYGWIIEIYLWFILLVSAVAGFSGIVPVLKSSGWILENEIAWRISGAIFLPVVTFLASAVVLGPVLVLLDIRKSVRTLESANLGSSGSRGIQPVELREPHL